jgi:hypothetical protein
MKSWGCVARFLPPLLLLCAWLGLTGCGTSSDLYITKDLSGPLEARTATVVTAGNGVKLSNYARELKKMLVKRLQQRGMFEQIGPDGDVVIRATIQNMDDGKTVGRTLSLQGKAEVTIEVKISKPNGTKLAHITASADSPRDGDEDRPDLRVLEAAADRIVGYLDEHRREAAGKSGKPSKAKAEKAKADKAEKEEVSVAEATGQDPTADEAKPDKSKKGKSEKGED